MKAMTLKRAREIAAKHVPQNGESYAVNAILAACREERYAALTEAAEVCYGGSTVQGRWVAAACSRDILALRDLGVKS